MNSSQATLGDRSRKHGLYQSSEYSSWENMKSRCNNKRHTSWPKYGGRGIVICSDWNSSFASFLRDMGYKPTAKHSIERIDNNGNYEPSNCKWATTAEQNDNRSVSVYLTLAGRTMTMWNWSREMGLDYATLRHRLKRGWSIKDAITKPAATQFYGRKSIESVQ